MMKRIVVLIGIFCTISSMLFASEGMWLPLFLKQLNEKEMKGMGMKMSADDIYNINKGSLKDAIVSFGGFCTGEVVSKNGLLFTNHHCGFDAIQSHSSLEHNYLEDGFWAMDKSQELKNPGLTATFIVRIEDVTTAALATVTAKMTEKERQETIDKNLGAIREKALKEKYQDVMVRPFFDGNQYFLFITETFKDIRLVGAPPSSVGKFGNDTDNWVWPRHTGDFSMFRIYANKDNQPAAYAEDNVPYTPKYSLPVSLDGVADGDFNMIFGFPGRTSMYLPSYSIQQIADVLNPAKIAIRDRALKLMDTQMKADAKIKIQYASKYAVISNYWKKWIGENHGFKTADVIGKKRKFEAEFQQKVAANPELNALYGNLLKDYEIVVKNNELYAYSRDYYNEFNSTVEIMKIAAALNVLVKTFETGGEKAYNERLEKVKPYLEDLFLDYNADVDKRVFAALAEMYSANVKSEFQSALFKETVQTNANDFPAIAADLYSRTGITSAEKVWAILGESPQVAVDKIKADPAAKMAKSFQEAYATNVEPKLTENNAAIRKFQRQYMAAQMAAFPDKSYYPDANSTMRVSYGKVGGYEARDAVYYETYTYLDGVMEKYVPGDYEFDVPKKLIELYKNKDYGPYGVDGKMPVNYIGGLHITGGNSGSPTIDGSGNLVGLAFDGAWEGLMSDYAYDDEICRTIVCDIRYVLFIIDKYGGAKHLVDEMVLVHPKMKEKGKGKKGKK